LSAVTPFWVNENEKREPLQRKAHSTRGSTRLRTKERVTGPGYSPGAGHWTTWGMLLPYKMAWTAARRQKA